MMLVIGLITFWAIAKLETLEKQRRSCSRANQRLPKGRVFRIIEIVIGLLLPLAVAGPFIASGLLGGIFILLFHGEPTMFLLSLCGVFGLLGLGSLLFNQNNMYRRQAELSTAGVFAGILPVIWLLERSLANLRYLDRGALLWIAVLLPPVILGLRRIVLLWKRQPPDSF